MSRDQSRNMGVYMLSCLVVEVLEHARDVVYIGGSWLFLGRQILYEAVGQAD